MRTFTAWLSAIAFLAILSVAGTGCKKELLSKGRVSDSTILAGSGAAGHRDGPADSATFYKPFGLALDNTGNLYIADEGNHLIRKIDPASLVTTLAGAAGIAGFVNAADTSASFNKPFGVATDASGNVYVADAGNNVIRFITPAGVVSTFAGTGVAGAANGKDTATFDSPLGVAADQSGIVYVADYGNNLVRKITPDGTVSTLAGKNGVTGSTNGLDTAATFDLPQSLAVDGAGNIYVADNGNNMIRKITPDGMVSTLAGNGSVGSANGSGASATFNSPFGIAVDAAGNVYVADSGNNLIRKITPGGVVSTFAGSGARGASNGTGASATFNTPSGLAVDGSGNVYVADENNNLIRKITPAGVVSTLASRGKKDAPNLKK